MQLYFQCGLPKEDESTSPWQGQHRAPLVVRMTGSPGEAKGRHSFLAWELLCGNNLWTYSIQRWCPNLEEGYKKGHSTSQKTGRTDLPTTNCRKRCDTLGPVLSSAVSWGRQLWQSNTMLSPYRHTGPSPTCSKTHAPGPDQTPIFSFFANAQQNLSVQLSP